MAEQTQETYDAEAAYDEEIAPLMTRIIKICNRHRIPMVASFAYLQGEGDDIGFCTTILNDFAGRHVEEFQHALGAIRRPGPTVLAMTITSNPKG